MTMLRAKSRDADRQTAARLQPNQQRQRSDHWVYKAYDREGTLLYVGITWQAFARLSEHRAESDWTASVVNGEIHSAAGPQSAPTPNRAFAGTPGEFEWISPTDSPGSRGYA